MANSHDDRKVLVRSIMQKLSESGFSGFKDLWINGF